jgi:hypothetical protein
MAARGERRGAIRLIPLLFSSRRIGDTIVGQLELAPVQLPTSLWSQLRSRRLGDTRRGRFLPAGVKSAGRALADPPPNKSVPAIPFPKLVQQRLPALRCCRRRPMSALGQDQDPNSPAMKRAELVD